MVQCIRNQGIWRAGGYQGPALVWITGTCTSSMDAARVLMRQKWMGPWSSVLALRQTVGRGRRKRSWTSPPGNLYGTWYWPFTADNERLFQYRPMASLLAGDILASVFSEMGVDVRIKWPNDIVWNNCKLCGILVEEKEGHVWVGIGVNLVSAPDENRMTNDALPPVCLDPGGDSVTPLAFWMRLMESGRQRLEHVTRSMRPEQFLNDLESRLAWIGRDIRVYREGEAPYEATLAGLAPDGGLKVVRKGNTEVIYTGTIRPV